MFNLCSSNLQIYVFFNVSLNVSEELHGRNVATVGVAVGVLTCVLKELVNFEEIRHFDYNMLV